MLAVVLPVALLCCSGVSGHGRLVEPPSRASMWRYGFSTPPDYNDHELYCGGFSRQWNKNGGKCGICGDPWDAPTPRAHELGGKYGLGVVVRKFRAGAPMDVHVELTANHRGYFEFRLCPHRAATQECLDKYLLKQVDGSGARFYPGDGGAALFKMRYRLPAGLGCPRCTLQWRYVAGNNWGDCGNGTQQVGCGPQEEFRSCADIAIEEGEVPEVEETTETAETSRTTVTPELTTPAAEPATSTYWQLFLVALATLIAVCVLIALAYLYFYHLSDSLKRLLLRNRPVPPPRTRNKGSQQKQPLA